jgi:UDP-3-O-[3-hydroxymyristoyl] glucosamine N-acyltransferase
MKISIRDIASLIDGSVTGDIDLVISDVSKIEDAKSGDITFLYLSAYEKYFITTKASAIIVKSGFSKTRDDLTYIEVASPEKAFFKILKKYFTPEFPLNGIDATSFIHPTAKLGNNVAVGKNVVISAGCNIGPDTKIFHNTVISENVEMGSECLIHANVSIRENCVLGNRIIIHSGAVVGSDGFGFSQNEKGEYEKIP